MASSSAAAVAILGVVLSSCRLGPPTEAAAAADCSAITAANIDACVRLNEIQVLGTHNSYHIAPAPPVLTLLGARAKNILAPSISRRAATR